MTTDKEIEQDNFKFLGDKIQIGFPKHRYIQAYIQRILKELVNTSIEQWLSGTLTDPSKPLEETVKSVSDQLEKSRKEATYKILEMFEIKDEYYK